MLIFLVGFMGAGKSTAAKRLSKALHMEFLDLDDLLVAGSGKTIAELIAEGEPGFRNKETAILKKLEEHQNTIIATGGGTPCFNDNMTWLNRHGITIYLRMSKGSLYRRLIHSKTERPLIDGKNEEDLKSYIEKTLAVREKFYLKAQYTVKGEDLDIRSLASWIRERQTNLS